MIPKTLFRNKAFQKTPRRWRAALTASAVAVLLATFASTVWAFPTYDDCKSCHGSFDSDNYTSKTDGTNWGTDLMSGHNTFVGSTCNACHTGNDFSEVFLNSSSDSTLSQSCVGCHGRDEDVTGNCVGDGGVAAECGSGAGLRLMHESKVGAGTCFGCHGDDGTPVGEDINPSSYGLSGVVMKDSCDGDSTESQYGATGLDNDGDGQRDAADSDCQGQANTPPTQPGTLSASMVTSSSATVQWAASTDPDGDPITYKVEYRHNGVTPWSNGGTTSNTSRSLSGLVAVQSYDVQVTPNDGALDGPVRSALNLFLTLSGSSFLIDAGINGNWWFGPDRSGEGVQVEVSDGGGGSLIMVTTVYSYNTMGDQIFMITVGPVIGGSAEVEVFITEGGLWGDAFDPSLVVETQWGTGTFSASSCDAMHMELRPNATYQALGYTVLAYDLIRLTVPAAPCPAN